MLLLIGLQQLCLDFGVHLQAKLGQHLPSSLVPTELVDELVAVDEEEGGFLGQAFDRGRVLTVVNDVFMPEDLALAVQRYFDIGLLVTLLARVEHLVLRLLLDWPQHLLDLDCVGILDP